MTDFTNDLTALLRPKILIRAARAGMRDYRRDRDLKRLLRQTHTQAQTATIRTLLTEEQRLEETRLAAAATYNTQRHVAVLTALIAEVQLATEGLAPTPARRVKQIAMAA